MVTKKLLFSNNIDLKSFTKSKIGETIHSQILPNNVFNIELCVENSFYVKFNLSTKKYTNIGN